MNFRVSSVSDVTEQGFQHDFRGGDCGRVEPNSDANANFFFSLTAAVAAVVGVVPSMLMLASKLKLSATCALQSRG